MFEHIVLARDLVDTRGNVLAPRGAVMSPAVVEEAARRAPALSRVALSETPLASDLLLPLSDPTYRHLFQERGVEVVVRRSVLGIRVPEPLVGELLALKSHDPRRYRHALATAVVASRMLVTAIGESPAISEFAAAGLLHDIGMLHVARHLVRNSDVLEPHEIDDVATHPLIGAWRLAGLLGSHPAVEAALAHHWRNGHGYPSLARAPMRAVEVVAVASAFAALTQERPYRSKPYDPRGAVDVLVAEARGGHRDGDTVRLLVHALRGARGEVRDVTFARARLGHTPSSNRYTPIKLRAAG